MRRLIKEMNFIRLRRLYTIASARVLVASMVSADQPSVDKSPSDLQGNPQKNHARIRLPKSFFVPVAEHTQIGQCWILPKTARPRETWCAKLAQNRDSHQNLPLDHLPQTVQLSNLFHLDFFPSPRPDATRWVFVIAP